MTTDLKSAHGHFPLKRKNDDALTGWWKHVQQEKDYSLKVSSWKYKILFASKWYTDICSLLK